MIHSKRVETFEVTSLEETWALAKDLAPRMASKQIIGLQGTLGAGKTHFVKALAEALGVPSNETNSPTFAILQCYQGTNKTLHHIDLYRLQSEDEIESSGFWDLFYDDNVILAIEWIERIDEDLLPESFSYWKMNWTLSPESSESNQTRIVEVTFVR